MALIRYATHRRRRPQVDFSSSAGELALVYWLLGGHWPHESMTIGDWCHLSRQIAETDWFITGGRCLDGQTINGKVVGHVVQIATKHRKPVIAVVGSRAGDLMALHHAGLSFALPILLAPLFLDTDKAMRRNEEGLEIAGKCGVTRRHCAENSSERIFISMV